MTREPPLDEQVVIRISDALLRDTRIDSRVHPITVALSDGVITLEGEVGDIAAKRRALACAAEHAPRYHVKDRVRVEPADTMGDGEIRAHVLDALLSDVAFADHDLSYAREGSPWVELAARETERPRGRIRVHVERGVVSLTGRVASLAHKRLLEVRAWWVPGTRDVDNDLEVSPPELDTDGEIADGVRLALEAEPFVDADQVAAVACDRTVILSGAVATSAQRDIAERDAWFVPGVRDVVNEIDVTGPER